MGLSRFLPAVLSLFGPSTLLAATFAGVEVPAPPPPKPVVDTHWGVQIEDPYRFLETTADPEVQKYMRAQADAAAAILAKIPARDRLLARIKEIDAATPAVVSRVRRDTRGGLFFTKRASGDNQFKLYRREKAEGPDLLLLDPDLESKEKGSPHAISAVVPSPDGRLVAYTMAAGGGEIGSIRVIDVATRKEITPPIDRVWGGGVVWLEDGSGF